MNRVGLIMSVPPCCAWRPVPLHLSPCSGGGGHPSLIKITTRHRNPIYERDYREELSPTIDHFQSVRNKNLLRNETGFGVTYVKLVVLSESNHFAIEDQAEHDDGQNHPGNCEWEQIDVHNYIPRIEGFNSTVELWT